ncbi:MAG: SGNH/GDSL hydrolase family protein [Actinobacteria bacterium]|nr:SGNH/GDSL hydrolase family protein [Actinomycetota bacterium]
MTWHRFVAIGDSFTEGLDDRADNGRHHGWADRVAATMAVDNPDIQYANLAIRGRRLDNIVTDQLPRAIAMEPDLISIGGGINDALRPRWDVNRSRDTLESGVAAARSAGIDVLLFSFGDPSRRSRALGLVSSRLSEYRDVVHAVASENDCYLVDFWDETLFDDRRFWADDRLHANELGHERVAAMVATTLGLGQFEWDQPLPPAPPTSGLDAVVSDARWTGQHLLPWFARHLRGRSSGDGIHAKRPRFETIEPDLALQRSST